MTAFTYELEIPPGIDSDDTTFSSQGKWTDSNNMRFVQGVPQSIGKSLLQYSGHGAVSAMIAARNGSTNHLYIGSPTTLRSIVGFSDTFPGLFDIDITPDGVGAAGSWSLQMYGRTLLASPSGGKLYAYTGTSSIPPALGAATEVTAAPNEITAMLVTAQRQVLAFGCNEEVSGVFNARCIRGSDVENYDDWTTTSLNNAFEHIIDGDSGIRTACTLGQHVVVWTGSGMYLGQFIGDPSQAYRFEKIDDIGIVSHKGYAISGGVVYFVAPNLRLYAWAPGQYPVLIACPILNDFVSNIAIGTDLDTIVVGNISRFNEIWIFYPDTRDGALTGQNTRYLAYSIAESATAQRPVWFRGKIGRSAILDGGTLHAMSTTFPAATLMADYFGDVYLHHTTTGAGTVFDCYIESAAQYLESGQRRFMVRSFTPDFEYQTGDLSLTLSVRDRPQSTAIIKGPLTIAASTKSKGCRTSGRLISLRISGVGVLFRLGKPTFDCVTLGER